MTAPQGCTVTLSLHADASSTQNPHHHMDRSDNFREVLLHEHAADQRERALQLGTSGTCLFSALRNVKVINPLSSKTVVPTFWKGLDLDTYRKCLFLSSDNELRIECKKLQFRHFPHRNIRRSCRPDASTITK